MYISEKIFRTEHPDEKLYFPYWEATKSGDWCKCDDGWITQLLDTYQLRNIAHKSGQVTTVYRFSARMCRTYQRADGSLDASKFYGDVVKLDCNHMTENYNPLGKYMSEKKRKFVMLLCAGDLPGIAYMKAYNVPYRRALTMGYRIAMQDENVIKEMNKHMKSNIIEDLEKHGISGDYIMNELKRTIEDNKTTSQVRAAILLFLTKVTYGLEHKGLIKPDPNDLRGVGGTATIGIMDNHPEELRSKLLERAKV